MMSWSHLPATSNREDENCHLQGEENRAGRRPCFPGESANGRVGVAPRHGSGAAVRGHDQVSSRELLAQAGALPRGHLSDLQ